MKQTIFAVLGNYPHLSLAEIKSFLAVAKIPHQLISFSDQLAIFSVAAAFDFVRSQERLAGAVKLGEVLETAESTPVKIAERLSKTKGKIFFGFSLYRRDENVSRRAQQVWRRRSGEWGGGIKRQLKAAGRTARHVTSRGDDLSSVVVEKNKLLTNGAEIVCLLGADQKCWWGVTKTVQPFARYSQRDYDRPAKDMVSGMLPPKLARLMLNLGQFLPDQTVLDPFCGPGTILQEALLMGGQNVIGGDISSTAIAAAEQNLKWLSRQTGQTFHNLKLMTLDARDVDQKLAPRSVDLIVTEPYLGPALKRPPDAAALNSLTRDLIDLYSDAFSVWQKILKTGGRVAMVWPVWRRGREQYFLPLKDKLERFGFRPWWPLGPQEELIKHRQDLTDRQTFLYGRPDQHVWREITLWQQA